VENYACAMIFKIFCATNYENRFKLLEVIEDKPGAHFFRHIKVKVMSICIAPVHQTSLRRSCISIARIVEGYLSFTCYPCVSSATRNRMSHTCLLPSQSQLVLNYRPRRDGRLSSPAEIRSRNLPIASPHYTTRSCLYVTLLFIDARANGQIYILNDGHSMMVMAKLIFFEKDKNYNPTDNRPLDNEVSINKKIIRKRGTFEHESP